VRVFGKLNPKAFGTPANQLKAGDRLLCADRTTVTVEEVFDTGEWELVYNLRVAEYHTYFVGDEGWGFDVWAHKSQFLNLGGLHPTRTSNCASLADFGPLPQTHVNR